MVKQIFLKNVFVLLATITLVISDEDNTLTWDGVAAYLAVDAATVQARLDQYAQSTPGAPQLYVPARPVFSNLQPGQHVMYVDFGTVTSLDFNEMDDISSSGSETTIVIPLLSDRVGGPPHYNLALQQLYSANRGDIPQALLLHPYTALENLTVGDSFAILRDRGEEMMVQFQIPNPCIKPNSLIAEEIEELFLKDLTFVSPDPDLAFCDRHPNIPIGNRYCSKMHAIRQEVEMNLPNVCSSFSSENENACEASLEVIVISPGFRELLLLGDGPIHVVSSERYYGTYIGGLRYPCI